MSTSLFLSKNFKIFENIKFFLKYLGNSLIVEPKFFEKCVPVQKILVLIYCLLKFFTYWLK